MRHPRRIAGRQSGFTLVELLVALVVTSVGLLGIAKLALGTVQSNDSAFMRSEATALVQHIVDDMRANQPQAIVGTYDIGIGAVPGAAPSCVDVACGATSTAAYDLSKWKSLLSSSLPGGDGSILTATEQNPLTGGNETVVTVTVQWDDTVAGQTFNEGGSTCPGGGNTKCLTVETML